MRDSRLWQTGYLTKLVSNMDSYRSKILSVLTSLLLLVGLWTPFVSADPEPHAGMMYCGLHQLDGHDCCSQDVSCDQDGSLGSCSASGDCSFACSHCSHCSHAVAYIGTASAGAILFSGSCVNPPAFSQFPSRTISPAERPPRYLLG